jgi:baseplate J-like protein
VKKVVDLVKAFSSDADALAADTSILETDKPRKLGADLEPLLAEVSGQYTFASARGWDNIAAWLEALIDDLEKLKKSTASPFTPDNQESEGERGAPGLPSFVELFEPFKLPQALQPNGEAHLNRNVLNIFSPRSEFVGRMYAVINPQAAPFVGAVLSNASVTNAPESSAKADGVIALSKGEAFRLRVSIAGHNLPVIIRDQLDHAGALVPTTVSPPSLFDYFQALSAAGFSTAKVGSDLNLIALDGEYSQIKIGGRVVIQHPASTGIITSTHIVDNVTPSELTFVGVPIKTSVLTLRTPWLLAAESQGGTVLESNALVRTTAVFAQNEELTLAETELSDVLSFSPTDPNLIELDGFYPNLESGRWTIISGERVVLDPQTKSPVNTGVVVSELIMVASVAHEAKTLINGVGVEVKGEKVHTFLRPAQLPAYSYRRSTVKVYGNVARATHGETRNEVLGSGEGSKAFQAFQLLQPPLTYLAAPVPSGTESTLAVRINDVLWSESDNLFALGPNVRKYITKTDDDGKTSVIFGDGEHGSRLPTGIENVKAVYRQGLGKGGNVKAEQIKLPLTKPLGVKSVINPMQASGGVDKETRDQARRNVPIAVLALDRLVSVQDYADFARTFAGIAKASAQRLSEGQREVVHLTIAGGGNIPIDVTSDLYRNLVASLGRFGDPLQPLEVESFERVLLVISAKVSVLPEYLWEKVKANLRATLWEKLGFENRELGQGVTMSEVISLMQAVPGIDYVDLDLLDSVSEETLKDPDFGMKLSLRRRVNAHLARMNQQKTDILPAQLLFLSQDAIDTLILEEIPA